MGIELCTGCTFYDEAAFPDITPHIHGYCTKAEWPFTLAIFKQELDGAFTAPNKCDWRKERKK